MLHSLVPAVNRTAMISIIHMITWHTRIFGGWPGGGVHAGVSWHLAKLGYLLSQAAQGGATLLGVNLGVMVETSLVRM